MNVDIADVVHGVTFDFRNRQIQLIRLDDKLQELVDDVALCSMAVLDTKFVKPLMSAIRIVASDVMTFSIRTGGGVAQTKETGR